MRHFSSGQGVDGRGWPETGEDVRGLLRTAGEGWGRQGTVVDYGGP